MNRETSDASEAQKGPLLKNLGDRFSNQSFGRLNTATASISGFAGRYFGGLWKLLFFLGAVTVTASGFIGLIKGLTMILSPFSMCNQIYLIVFGSIMLVIDSPIEAFALIDVKMSIFRYLLFMTRFTGRGFWYVFLATMIWGSLFNLNIEPLLGFFLGNAVGALGVISIVQGIRMSLKLEKARKAVCGNGPAAVMNMCPSGGLTLPEFNDLCKNQTESTTFDAQELSYVAAALSYQVRADATISQQEFQAWTQGRMTIM